MNRKQLAALFVLCLAVFMVAVDGTVISVAIPAITDELQPDYNQILWIGDIYSFVLAGLLVTMGNVGDRIGRKRLLMIATVAFGITSVAAALAPTAEALIAARALQGVAGAGLMPPTLALLRTVFTDEAQRMKAVGLWSASGAAGAALGPTIAGLLLEYFYWGSVLLVNLPVVALIVVVGMAVLPEARSQSEHPMDPVSVVMSTVGILAVVYGITELAHSGLAHWQSYVAIVVGAGLLWAFLVRQRRLPVPLLDLQLFAKARFTAAILAQMIIVFANVGALFFLPVFLRQAYDFTPLQSGLALLPESLTSMITAPLAGRFIRRFGHTRVLLVGIAAGSAGLILLGFALGAGYPFMVVPLMMLGFSFALVITSASDLVLMSASDDRVGAATGISETSFELGTALGIAITGSAVSVAYLVISGNAADFSDAVDPAVLTSSLRTVAIAGGVLLAMAAALIARAVNRPEQAEHAPAAH